MTAPRHVIALDLLARNVLSEDAIASSALHSATRAARFGAPLETKSRPGISKEATK
jgi:hypothetical protein